MGKSLLVSFDKRMNSVCCNLFVLFACLAAVLVPFTVDAGYVSKQNHCRTEYETVTTYEKQCSTTNEEECSTVKEEQCKPKVEEVCNTVEVQDCCTTHEKQCSTSHEDKCSTVFE